MSGLSAGLSTFNSCNKAGSIPLFTQHLARFPNDYTGHMWRGRAYSIIGKTAEARADFQKAYSVSVGPKKCLAEAHLENLNGNQSRRVAILQSTTGQYPNFAEAWSELGSHTYRNEKKVDLSLQHLGRASDLALINSETKEPWFPWCSQTMGDIYYFEKQQIEDARKYYQTAVQSGNTLTIGHLGLSRCDILSNNMATAKTSFLTAKRLNPVLVQWETFDHFRLQVLQSKLQSQIFQLGSLLSSNSLIDLDDLPSNDNEPSSPQQASSARDPEKVRQSNLSALAERPQAQSRRSASRYQGGRSGNSGGSGIRGNGGSGDGSGGGSDDDDLTPEDRWKKMKKRALSAKKYHNMRFYQFMDEDGALFWLSRISSSERHANAFAKKYIDKGATIELLCSVDENLREIHGKHESGKYGIIKKRDMDGI